MQNFEWPYPLEWDKEETISADVLVLGGGIAGCMAAISAARNGQNVVFVEKGATKMSGARGSGCEKERIYGPIKNNSETAIGWKELNMGTSKIMQNYCGDIKYDELLNTGLLRLKEYEEKIVAVTYG